MALSRLLLTVASSQKYIPGKGKDKLCVNPRKKSEDAGPEIDPYAKEIVLCFPLDGSKEIKEKLACWFDPPGKLCDGVIFFADDNSNKKVICCVEMKSTNIDDADQQIIETRQYIKKLLNEELKDDSGKLMANIEWRACIYHHCTSPKKEVGDIEKKLRKNGFKVMCFDSRHNDAGPFLRGNEESIESAKKKYERGKNKNHGKK